MLKFNSIYYFGLIALALFIRSLTWNSNFLNIDELEWIYLLQRIKVNAIPFEGFVAHTTGPLAIYFLSFLNFVQENPTLSGLRQFQFFICIVPSFYLLYKSVSAGGKWISNLIFFLFIITNDSKYSLTASVNDFFAYNTEYMLMITLAIIYYLQQAGNPKSTRIFFTALMCFGLFFIKSQAIVFSCYFLCIYFIQLYLHDIKKAYLLILYTSIIALLITFLMFTIDIWDSFLVEYLHKNFLYAQSNNSNLLSQLVNINQVFLESILYFWILFGAFVVYLLWRIFKLNDLVFLTNSSLNAVLFLFVSLFVVFVSTNNFNHYKVFLFFPMSLTLGEIFASFRIQLLQHKVQVAALILLTYVIFYRSVFLEAYQYIANNKLEEYRNSIGVNPLYVKGANPFWSTNNNLNKKERIRVFQFLRKKLNSDNHKSKIYIFGWFVGQGYYYELLKFGVPVSKSAQNQYLLNWFFAKDFNNFQKEEKQLISELKKNKPEWIVDSEFVLYSLKNLPIERFVVSNYNIAYKSENFIIYRYRDLK